MITKICFQYSASRKPSNVLNEEKEGILFLGCKDMNVYQIDVSAGKLAVVYEGHWSRIARLCIVSGNSNQNNNKNDN